MSESAALETKLKEVLYKKNKLKEQNLLYYFKPYPYQQKIIDSFNAGKKLVIMPAPNKVGKTAGAAAIIISWCLGYEPWNNNHQSCLGINPPVKIRITGEDWLHHVGKTIVPELKKWAPKGTYTTRKNNQGIEYFWEFNNHSTLELMTYDQEDALFEGWLGHGWWADEPPPRSKYSGMSRGLFTTGGKMFFSMTPLKEAWILDELILSDRTDVGVIDGISVWDNPELYGHDFNVLASAGFAPQEAHDFMQISKALKDTKEYLANWLLDEDGNTDRFSVIYNKLKIERFVNDIPEEERSARLFGQFKHLVGLVLKEFNKDVHVIEPFKIPTDWPVVPMIDLHLNTPQAISFYAKDKVDRTYCIDEIWENLPPEEIADEIIRKKNLNSWNITRAFIDPLSKGDSAFMKNRLYVEDSFTIIKRRLAAHGIYLDVASKDKDSGVRNIKNQLTGVNKIPSLFFFNNCKKHIWEIQRWIYGDDGKPKKEFDHFEENLYRFTLTGTTYKSVELYRETLKHAQIGDLA